MVHALKSLIVAEMVDETAMDFSQSVDATDSSKMNTFATDRTTEQKSSTTRSGSGKKRRWCFQFCEVVTLTPVILAIVGLFSIPSVLYALSEAEV